MSESPESTVAKNDQPKASRDELTRLKELILANEHHALSTLQSELLKVQDLPGILAERHGDSSDRLSKALALPLVDAVKISASKEGKELSSALFPIMGPAIRLYVSDMLRGLTEQLNETIKSATSVKQIKWRAEAKMMGKPYSEYLLLKTINYRIEYVLMVDPDSGLLLQQVSRDSAANDNPELVSSMLVAIRSFVRDSFAQGGEGELGRFSFGEHEIFLETGPDAIIAAVGTGTPPPAFRSQMKETLEAIHTEGGETLANFDGDQSSVAFSRIHLEKLLVENKAVSEGSNPWPLRIAAGIVGLGLLGVAGFYGFENWKWKKAVTALQDTPGIEVYQNERGWWNKRILGILHDPLAVSPVQVIESHDIAISRAKLRITPFESPNEPMASQRAAEEEKARNEVIRQYEERLTQLNEQVSSLQETSVELRKLASTKGISPEQWQTLLASDFYSRYQVRDSVDLNFDADSNTWKVSGRIEEPVFSQIQEEAADFFPDSTVDTSTLQDSSADRMAELRDQIEKSRITFLRDSEIVSKDGFAARERVHRALSELEQLHRLTGTFPLPNIEIFATSKASSSNLRASTIIRKRLILESEALEEEGFGETRVRPVIDRKASVSSEDTLYFRIK